MATAWPASLPQVFPIDTQVEPVDNLVRTEPEVGPVKIRRRTAKVIEKVPVTFPAFTGTQVGTLLTFYRTTLAHGTLPMTWIDPVTDAAKDWYIEGEPTRVAFIPNSTAGSRYWRVSMMLRSDPI